jgi:hypothetical protein
MTAIVLCLLSHWQGGQAATVTPDAITNLLPSQEASTGWYPQLLELQASFLMLSALHAGSARPWAPVLSHWGVL